MPFGTRPSVKLGYENLKAPFVHFVLEEVLERETLTKCRDSCMDYWLPTIKSNDERHKLKEYASQFVDIM